MLTIEQVGGRLRLDLDGADLPDAPLAVPVEQRVMTSWAPGATRPVVQVLGVKHGSMTLRGVFTDAQTRYESARAAVDVLTAMVRAGRPVRVTWVDVIDRTGLLLRADPQWELTQIVGWEVEFDPHEVETTSTQEARLRAMQSRPDAEAAARAMSIAALAGLAAQRTAATAAWVRLVAA